MLLIDQIDNRNKLVNHSKLISVYIPPSSVIVSTALGSDNYGCRMPCHDSIYGCCEDGITPAHGPNNEGCCLSTPYKCCPDNSLPARGLNFYGCGCQYTRFGCCPDNSTVARGLNNEGCGCLYTPYGCCPNRFTPASGRNFEGCPCYTYQFGCCPDGITIAKGSHGQGNSMINIQIWYIQYIIYNSNVESNSSIRGVENYTHFVRISFNALYNIYRLWMREYEI